MIDEGNSIMKYEIRMKYEMKNSSGKREVEIGEHSVYINHRTPNGSMSSSAIRFSDIEDGPFEIRTARSLRNIGAGLLFLGFVILGIVFLSAPSGNIILAQIIWSVDPVINPILLALILMIVGPLLSLISLPSRNSYIFLDRDEEVILDLPYRKKDKYVADQIAQKIVQRTSIQRTDQRKSTSY